MLMEQNPEIDLCMKHVRGGMTNQYGNDEPVNKHKCYCDNWSLNVVRF